MGRCLLVLAVLCAVGSMARATEPLRAGIIGLDTSHVVAFAKVLSDSNAKGVLKDVRIVAAFPGGSPDLPSSRDRVAGYTRDLKEKYGVEIVDSIDTLMAKVDVVFLESVDGRPHLNQVIPVFKARKPVFIDKPVAGSLVDAIKIFDLAKEHQVPCFSSSSLRFSPGIAEFKNDPKLGEVTGCTVHAPCSLEEHHPDLFWYGIHGVETLFTIMGAGCESVQRTQTPGAELVTGVWKGGKIGTFRGLRAGKSGYGALVYGSKGIVYQEPRPIYDPLLLKVCEFFKSGKPPVSAEETLEIFAFMEAADESKRQGGAVVSLANVMAKAREEARRR